MYEEKTLKIILGEEHYLVSVQKSFKLYKDRKENDFLLLLKMWHPIQNFGEILDPDPYIMRTDLNRGLHIKKCCNLFSTLFADVNLMMVPAVFQHGLKKARYNFINRSSGQDTQPRPEAAR
jgi:hypothetical protein